MEKRFDSLFEQKARRKYLTQGRTFMSRPTNIKRQALIGISVFEVLITSKNHLEYLKTFSIFLRTKREFLDELRECRDQIFDAPIKRIKLLENQARVKNVLHSVRTRPSDATFTFS